MRNAEIDRADSNCTLSETARKIAITFQDMVMERGYNAVSYGDLAKELGIRTASIHYHFPCKVDLGVCVIRRYRRLFQETLQEASIDDPQSYLRAYESFTGPIKPMRDIQGAACLCGVLGAEFQSLDGLVQNEVKEFFNGQDVWLETLFSGGREAGVFHFKGDAMSFAKLFTSAMQGAMLIKKSTGSPEHFDAVLGQLEMLLFGRDA
jgi:TetR/AcrR family transcriptional repressor of nem operon